MADPRVPLSTLRRRPCDRRRMTRGRGGWLGLPRTTLSFAIPCRSPGALMPEQPAESLAAADLAGGELQDARPLRVGVAGEFRGVGFAVASGSNFCVVGERNGERHASAHLVRTLFEV